MVLAEYLNSALYAKAALSVGAVVSDERKVAEMHTAGDDFEVPQESGRLRRLAADVTLSNRVRTQLGTKKGDANASPCFVSLFTSADDSDYRSPKTASSTS